MAVRGKHQPLGEAPALFPKKIRQRPIERNEHARWQFRALLTGLDPERVVWLDESSAQLGLRREYGLAPVGQRLYGEFLRNHGANRSLLSAMSLNGMLPSLLIDGSATRAVFEHYLEHVLGPYLRPGQMLILDNYSIHHGGRVPEIARKLGIDLLYLPGYSPDLNAIELAFSKLKAHLRKAAALTLEALSQALGEALAAVTLQDIRGFFREVGCWRQFL